MVHRFVSRCQFGPGTSRSQMLKCAIWLGMLGVGPGAGWNDPAPRGVSSWWSSLEGRNWFGPRGSPCGARGPNVWCVLGGVLLSRTLAGAVPSALSGLASGFGMGPGVSLSL